MSPVLAGIAGAVLTLGLFLIVIGLIPVEQRPPKVQTKARHRRLFSGPDKGKQQLRAALAVFVCLAVWAVFGWFIGGVIAGVMAAIVPSLLGAANKPKRYIERAEALQEWTHGLSGVLAQGTGLTQALSASLRTAPEPMRREVGALVARLDSGWTPSAALQAFADDLDDANGDLAVAALLLAAQHSGPELGKVLEGLASTTADEVAMARKVEADRETPRSTARTITLITLAVIAVAPLWPTWRNAYNTLLGQIAFAVLMSAYLGCLYWMHKISTGKPEARFLFTPKGA